MDNTPNSEISEIAVLGTMISFPETIRLYIEKDFPLDVFFSEDNKRVAKVLLQVYKERGIVEYQMILDKFASVTDNEKPVNCSQYLMNLIQNATTKSTFGYYLNIIEEKYKVRSLVEKSREIIHLASQPIDDVDEFLFEVEQDVLGLTRTSNSNDMRTSESIVQEALNNFTKAMQSDGSVTGLKTGFRELDKVTNGFQDGDLIILGARPSVGKSAFALNLGLNVARLNNEAKSVVAIFSLEMPATQLINRITSTVSTVPNYKIRDGRVNQDEFNNINKAYSTIQSLNLYVDDDGSITVLDIFKKCRSLKDEQGLDIIIIDYMQLINSKQQGQNRQAEISVISRQMKQLAREMNVPVIALSQLSRKLEQREDKTPILSDLRESGSIEQDADIVMFLHRDDYGKTDDELDGFNSNVSETLLRVAKNRNGSLKDINLAFEKNTGKFTDVEYTRSN